MTCGLYMQVASLLKSIVEQEIKSQLLAKSNTRKAHLTASLLPILFGIAIMILMILLWDYQQNLTPGAPST